jgi:hypothetical protein
MLRFYSLYIEKDFNSCMRTRLSHALIYLRCSAVDVSYVP